MRAFIHSQHLLGSGHVVRAAALGKALHQRGFDVVLATGNHIPSTLNIDELKIIELPAARAANVQFEGLVDEDGAAVDEAWWGKRIVATLSAFHSNSFDLLLTETYPFGRRMFAAEMTRLLEEAKALPSPPWIACSLRDILVSKDESWKEEWMAAQANAFYDRVLVHSDPQLVMLEDSFPFVDQISPLMRYTGYISDERGHQPPSADGHGEIVVSCGGGAVGQRLLDAALSAATSTSFGLAHRWRLLVGHDLSEASFQRLQMGHEPHVVVERARSDFPAVLKNAALSISQAGYNTVVDVLRAGVPAVLVPFAQAGETEQTQRALSLFKRGRVVALPESLVGPDALVQSIEKALSLPDCELHVALNGAEISAQILAGDLGLKAFEEQPHEFVWERGGSHEL